MQRTFHDSNQTADEVSTNLQNCESDTEHSDREKYSDHDKEPETNRNSIGNFKDVRCPSK
jgi:hypothetical protein